MEVRPSTSSNSVVYIVDMDGNGANEEDTEAGPGASK